MKLRYVLLLAFLSSAVAQQNSLVVRQDFSSAGTYLPLPIAGFGSHTLTFSPATNAATTGCLVEVDSGPTVNGPWTTGGIIASTACNEAVGAGGTVSNSANASYARINVTAITAGTIRITYTAVNTATSHLYSGTSPIVVTNNVISCPTCGTGSGTVSSVTCGTGLAGGTITGTGTCTLSESAVQPLSIGWFFNTPFPTAAQATSQDFGAVLASAFAFSGAGGPCIDLSYINTLGVDMYATTNPFVGMGTNSNPCIQGANFTVVTGVTWETPGGALSISGLVPAGIGNNGFIIQPCNTATTGCLSGNGVTVPQFPSSSTCASSGGLNCWATGLPSSSALTNYTTGTVSVTNGSRTVTGSGVTWTSAMIGGFFLSGCPSNTCTVGSTSSYTTGRIVNVSGSTITLEAAYTGTTASGNNYIIYNPNTAVVFCDGCLTSSMQSSFTGHYIGNLTIDVNGVGGGVGFYTKSPQEGNIYFNFGGTLQGASATGAAEAGTIMAWDNSLREAKAGTQTFTGHWYLYGGRIGMGVNVGGSSSYGAVIEGYSLMDGSVGNSNADGPGLFELQADIGGTGSARFQDALYVDGVDSGRFYGTHLENVLNDDVNFGAVNPVYGVIVEGFSSSGTMGNAVIEFHSGSSGNQALAITRPSGGVLVEDDNLGTPTVATSSSGTPASWTLASYIQPSNSSNSLILGGNLVVDGTASVGGNTVLTTASNLVLSAVNPQTATYQVLATDFSAHKTITVASGTFTITLVASTSQPAAGQYIKILNYGSGTVTVAASGQNINGSGTSQSIAASSAAAPSTLYVESDGTNYFADSHSLNAQLLLAKTWAAPANIGSTTAATGKFTTLQATGLFVGSNTQRLTADTSNITATTPAGGTVVFTWGALTVSTNFSFFCAGTYTQATAAGGVSIAVQGATNAPTKLDAWATLDSTNPASTTYTGTKSGTYALASTTATNVATVTPGATGTQYQWTLNGSIQVGASASTLNIIFYSGSSSDAVVVKEGSFCTLTP